MNEVDLTAIFRKNISEGNLLAIQEHAKIISHSLRCEVVGNLAEDWAGLQIKKLLIAERARELDRESQTLQRKKLRNAEHAREVDCEILKCGNAIGLLTDS
jgi:hypothetical protein